MSNADRSPSPISFTILPALGRSSIYSRPRPSYAVRSHKSIGGSPRGTSVRFALITLFFLLFLPLGAIEASGGVIFEENFDSQSDWNVNHEYDGECSYPCPTAPPGWSATRMVPGNDQFVHPTGSIQRLPGGLPDHTGTGSGKAYVIWAESNSTINWPGDSLLAKVFPQDYPEIYFRLWIRTQSGWQWDTGAGAVSGSKVARIMHYSRSGNIFQFFGDGNSCPVYVWDTYYSTTYGNRLSNSYRCSPQTTDYYCPNSPGTDGGQAPDNALWPGTSYTDTPVTPGMFADTSWHRLDVHIKLNSAPGVNDGILAFWWDADPNTAPPTYTRTNIQWMSANSDTQRGWNTFGIGGNNNNSFSGATNGEQWYAIDDVVLILQR